ncbi:hypothetical protein E4U55_003802 [Claviceps digitariae]|nr:hypothetical protein E4U55_003802 [Claviceps digitariae]
MRPSPNHVTTPTLPGTYDPNRFEEQQAREEVPPWLSCEEPTMLIWLPDQSTFRRLDHVKFGPAYHPIPVKEVRNLAEEK